MFKVRELVSGRARLAPRSASEASASAARQHVSQRFDLLIGQPCSETFLEGSHPTHSAFDHFMLSIYDYVLFM